MPSLTNNPAWMPLRIQFSRDGPSTVKWQHTGTTRFTHPFYADTMSAVAENPRCTTTLTELEHLAQQLPARPPDGFIFHISRCGSTLVSRMLAALPQHLVLSEPSPLNDILWPEDPAALPDESRRAALLESIVRILTGQRPENGHTFIKCDAWHLLDLPLFLRVFPNVPVAFVYRDPLEILVSHQRQRGAQMVPGFLDPDRLGVPVWNPATTTLDAFTAQVLARLMDSALTHLPPHALLLNYAQLPSPGLAALLTHFRLPVTPAGHAAMIATAATHAKHRGLPFTPDSAARQAAADPSLRALAATHTADLYHRLESRRTAGIP